MIRGTVNYRVCCQRILLFILTTLFSIQCSGSAPTSPSLPTLSAPPPSSSVLAELSQARSIHIRKRVEYGISTQPWITEDYLLNHVTDQFTGQATFTVDKGWLLDSRQVTDTIAIPVNTVQAALQLLAEVPLEQGIYIPLLATDGGRSKIQISLELATDVIVTFTFDSMNETDNSPWVITIGSETYLTQSNNLKKALEMLQPYLKSDIRDKLIQESTAP